MERFELTCYGCGEPIDDRFDIVKEVSNLRRCLTIMADELQHDYIAPEHPDPLFREKPQQIIKYFQYFMRFLNSC